MAVDLHPAGLQVTEQLDHVEIRLPPDLNGAGLVYWVLSLGAIAAGIGPLLFENPTGEGLLVAVVAASVSLALLAAIGRLLAALVRWMAVRPGAALALSFLLVGGLTSGLAMAGLGLSGLALGAVNGIFYAGLLFGLSRLRSTLRLDGRTLRVDRGKKHLQLPLEQVEGISRHGRWLPDLRVGDQVLPASGGVNQRQALWLDELVREQAGRQRAALERQGQHLDQQAAPPPELLARLDRS